MKNLKTITEKEILEAAWSWYLMKWSYAVEKAENAENILGRKSEIEEARVKKYKEIMEELHEIAL